ncbi:hypothetical protein [Curtobacterium sp. SGAir0471]|uniref:hypothetical protein n=1 Tax=Curtobacterium sp. SGAir0471 TaxID=2070337 RepID=UPI001586B356|nr:hypothetical protein [Curtobacterium sp. SGAir0471]
MKYVQVPFSSVEATNNSDDELTAVSLLAQNHRRRHWKRWCQAKLFDAEGHKPLTHGSTDDLYGRFPWPEQKAHEQASEPIGAELVHGYPVRPPLNPKQRYVCPES